MNVFAELRRRNVIRMAGLYLVVAWLLVQIAETLLPIFKTPDWVLQTLVVLLALGFVPALVFAWVFELTPDGLKRDREIAPESSIAPQTARKMDRLIVAGMIAVVAVIAADRLWPEAPRVDATANAGAPRDADASSSTSAGDAAGTGGPTDADGTATTAAASAPENSIAVLPFANMSGDPANEYFSDGISEEILNVLAGTPELQVAARTSSFSFKGQNAEIPAIARALNVRLVLEGSVRQQGDTVRITAQLIDAQTGFHRWSQTYDRKLVDIFAIQDEIAKAIGDALKVSVGGGGAEGHAVSGTTDLAAYDLYLRGMALWHGRTPRGLEQAVDLFEQAAMRDDEFAQAWAGQALTYAILPAYSPTMTWDEAIPLGTDRALRALALDPSLPEAYAALGISLLARWQRDTADALLRRAIKLRPSYPTGHHWLANALMTNGRQAQAVAAYAEAVRLDPRSPVIGDNRAFALLTLGRDADARAECERVLAFAPDYTACVQYAAVAALRLGDHAAAREGFGRLWGLKRPDLADKGRALADALAGTGDRRAMAEWLASQPMNSFTDPASDNNLEDQVVVLAIAALGEPALALDYFERIGRVFGNTMDWAVPLSELLDPIRCDPRFRAVVAELRTSDPRFDEQCGAAAKAAP